MHCHYIILCILMCYNNVRHTFNITIVLVDTVSALLHSNECTSGSQPACDQWPDPSL